MLVTKTFFQKEPFITVAVQNQNKSALNSAASEYLGRRMAAIRLAFTRFGTRKTPNNEQKSHAADTFGVEREFLSAGKKLLDTSHPAFKAVTAVRSRIINCWNGISMPYPESGVRLIRQEDIDPVTLQLTILKADLAKAVEEL